MVKLTCNTKDAQIYYTLDGTEPTGQSKQYENPFELSKTTTVKMVAFKEGRKSLTDEAVIEKASMSKPVKMNNIEPGLSYKYIHGTFRMVNDFLKMEPVKTGVVPSFTIEPREKEQFFAFNFEGYITIPKDGLYTFYLTTNDGGILYLDNKVLINNDGLHPLAEAAKPVALKAGLHPIWVKYFQEGGTNGLLVSWQGPDFEKEEIPAKVLFHIK
jgi:hypothetical protein